MARRRERLIPPIPVLRREDGEMDENGCHLMDHLARFLGQKGEYATFVGYHK